MYDCRIFKATGLYMPGRPVVAARAKAWRFVLADETDRRLYTAVRRAAAFLSTFGDRFPDGFVPAHRQLRAVLALKIHEAFIDTPAPCDGEETPVWVAAKIDAVFEAYERFEAMKLDA